MSDFIIKDKRRSSPDYTEEPKEVCRVCGSEDVHTREYNQPTMQCIQYLRDLVENPSPNLRNTLSEKRT